jgi:cephalosporin hydroxylase
LLSTQQGSKNENQSSVYQYSLTLFNIADSMKHTTRLRIARAVNFFRPQPARISLSVSDILCDSASIGIVDQFNKLYYESGVAGTLNWRGIQVIKNPCDLWMMLELLQTVRPSVLIETGTHYGGSALLFSDMMSLLGIPVTIITVDFNPKWSVDPSQHRIESIVGYSTDPGVVASVRNAATRILGEQPGPVMVTLDSDHSEENVSRELQLYAPMVTPGSYLVVEDTNVNGHPASPDHGPGPWEAVQAFLVANPDFQADLSCQRHLLTFFPNGWLKRRE